MTQRLWSLVLLLAAFGLRVVGLGHQELRGDEAFGYFFSLVSPAAIVSRTLELAEPHPVASYWLQHGWLGLTGHSEFALRFPSAWWSVLAVALLLALGRRLELLPDIHLAGGVLAAISPYLIWHAQDARMYSMSLALTTAATWAAISWWRRPSWRTGAVYTALALLSLHTHYYAVYVLIGHGVTLVALALQQKRIRHLGILLQPLLATALLFLPWLLLARHILAGYGGNGDSPTLLDATVRAHAVMLTGATTPVRHQWLPAALLLAALVVGAIHVYYVRPLASVWLVTGWLVPLGLTWLSAQARPIFDERYLVAAASPVYLLAGASLLPHYRLLRRPRLLVALCVAAMLVGLWRSWTLPVYSKDRGWRELAARLETLAWGVAPTTVRFAQNYPDPTLWYYYSGPVPHLVLPPQPNNLAAAEDEVARMAASNVERVVLVEQPSTTWDADGLAQSALKTQFEPIADTQIASWPLFLYTRPPAKLAPVDMGFANGVTLAEAAIIPTTLPPGGWLTVHLAWAQGHDVPPSTPDDLAVSVQLLDGAGHLVAQQDRPLPDWPAEGSVQADYGILIPSSLTPGQYALTVVLYDPSQLDLLPISLANGDVRAVVTTIEITDVSDEGRVD